MTSSSEYEWGDKSGTWVLPAEVIKNISKSYV